MGDSLNILHRLTFARGSEALEFVRTLRDQAQAQVRGGLAEIGPILVYGARIVAPDSPAELYVSVGALTLVHLLGVAPLATWPLRELAGSELPADMALLFTTADLPDENALR